MSLSDGISNEKYCYLCKQPMGKLSGPMVSLSCDSHKVDVVHWFGGNSGPDIPFELHFRIMIGDKFYKVNYWLPRPQTKIYIRTHRTYSIYCPILKKNEPHPLDTDDLIVEVEGILNITPENAEKKLPLILTFS